LVYLWYEQKYRANRHKIWKCLTLLKCIHSVVCAIFHLIFFKGKPTPIHKAEKHNIFQLDINGHNHFGNIKRGNYCTEEENWILYNRIFQIALYSKCQILYQKTFTTTCNFAASFVLLSTFLSNIYAFELSIWYAKINNVPNLS
jgi:hypothetical protein